MGVSPVLEILASRFRSGRAGRSAHAVRDVILPFNKLLKDASCLQGSARHEAIQELEKLDKLEILILEYHSSSLKEILKVRLPLSQATAFFTYIGTGDPGIEREELAEMFRLAATLSVPERFQNDWEKFCRQLMDAARLGNSMLPFDRTDSAKTKIILNTLPRILGWQGESLMRFASSVIYGDSKTLEALRPRIEACLAKITNNPDYSLSDMGILENDRSCFLHGPLKLIFRDGELDLRFLSSPIRVAASDLRQARLETTAKRSLTVENVAMLNELAKRQNDILLISSGSEGGFANSAVIEILQQLPHEIERWHFGDSDPKGFDILRDLRERARRDIRSLHMRFRPVSQSVPLRVEDSKTIERLCKSSHLTESEKNELDLIRDAGSKGAFEQEALGLPLRNWPFY